MQMPWLQVALKLQLQSYLLQVLLQLGHFLVATMIQRQLVVLGIKTVMALSSARVLV